jgi:hypothetical protein
MQDVRDKLETLRKAQKRVEKLYERLSTPASAASGEAMNRLYLSQEALGHPLDSLHDSLETASSIVDRALVDLPRVRRSTRLNSVDVVLLILKALGLGHAEHFVNRREPMPAFLITVTRKKKPFPQVAQIVSEASGGWSVEDAIRAYQAKSRGELAPQ